MLNRDESDAVKTLSVMFGVFMGIFPVWGFQLLIGIPLAHFMRLNKAVFVAAAHISVPPMIPVLIFASYKLGGLFLGNPESSLHFSNMFSIDRIKSDLYNYFAGAVHTFRQDMFQYLVGAVVLSILAGLVSGLFTYALLKLFPRKEALGSTIEI